MNRERIKWLAFAAISAGLAVAVVRTWWPQWLPSGLAAASDQNEPLEIDELPELKDVSLVRLPVWVGRWQAAPWPENPFPTAPSAPEAGMRKDQPQDLPAGRYVLQAVLWGRAPVALLSGRLVTAGSRLPDGSTVEQILADRVVLATSGGRVEIPLARSVEADQQEQHP